MKTTVKITLISLMCFSFCSCSSEDAQNPSSANHKNTLTVEVENLQSESVSRSANDADGNALYWQTGDIINVYDENLKKYDTYNFSPGDKAFVTSATSSYIDGTISYAFFPGDMIQYNGWTSHGIRAVMYLATPIVAGTAQEDVTTVPGKTIYTSNLPMWGTATGDFGKVYVSLKYLTAVMKLNLENVAGNATFIKISSSRPLSGGFEAVVASSDNVFNPDAMLKEGETSLSTQNYMVVDLRGVESSKTTVYVPIITATYDDLTVSYTNKEVEAKKTLSKSSINGTDGTEWTVIKTYPESKELKRATVYKVNKTF